MHRKNRVAGLGDRAKRYGEVRRLFEALGVDIRPKRRIIGIPISAVGIDYGRRSDVTKFRRIKISVDVTERPTPLPVTADAGTGYRLF